MITILGFLILVGTVVNNPILVVDQALLNLREGRGMNEAVHEAVASRLRPILMSTITTIFGLAPLVPARRAQRSLSGHGCDGIVRPVVRDF